MTLLSVICVFSDLEVRRACLDRSLEPVGWSEIEYITVDNRDGRYATAGQALNQGAMQARGDVLAFTHQDVRLHSVAALQRAARSLLGSDRHSLLGAVGMDAAGRVVGRMRDRVVLLGRSTAVPVDVDTVDEVLFMMRKSTWETQRLSEAADLAWHAYAVDYGLTLRDRGLGTGAVDIPLTHNSATTNLSGLSQAHAAVVASHPSRVPAWTTCGLLRPASPSQSAASGILRANRWRYRWLCKSTVAAAARGVAHSPVVLADIRREVDTILSRDRTLRVVNVEHQGSAFTDAALAAPFTLQRRSGVMEFEVVSPAGLRAMLAAPGHGGPVLVTNLRMSELAALDAAPERARTVGLHEGIGLWALLGGSAAGRLDIWPKRSLPAGARAWSRLSASQSTAASGADSSHQPLW